MDPRNANKQLDESIKDNRKELAKGNHEQLDTRIENYEFLERLGKGGQGTVNLCKRKTDGERYAIKHFSIDKQQFSIDKQRAVKEAELLMLPPEHDNIVRCFGSWRQDDTFYMLEEHLKGMDLLEYHQTHGQSISQTELLSIIIGSLSGVAHLHDYNIWHRDLKLENLFRTDSGTIKLFDLGLGLHASGEFTKSLVGTPIYASPELVNLMYNKDSSGYSSKHDMFQLAVIYFILVAGYHPFVPKTGNVKLRNTKTFENIRGKEIRLRQNKTIPYDQRILNLIKKCGAKDPKARPTAKEALGMAIDISKEIETEGRIEGAKQVSVLVENYFLSCLKDKFIGWVKSLKKDIKFETMKREKKVNETRKKVNEKLVREELKKKKLALEGLRQQVMEDQRNLQEQRDQLRKREKQLQEKEEKVKRDDLKLKKTLWNAKWNANNIIHVTNIQTFIRKVLATRRYRKDLHDIIVIQRFIRKKLVQQKWYANQIPKIENRYAEHYANSVRHAFDSKVAKESNIILQNRNNELALEKVQTENHNHALLLNMEQLQEEYATLVRNVEGIHKDLICPITLERFVDPVIARDGYVYESEAIQQWFDNHRISPMTNGPLTDTRLTPCHKMKTIARAFDDVAGNNNNVQELDTQLKVVRENYQRRFEQSVKKNEDLQDRLNDSKKIICEQTLELASEKITIQEQNVELAREKKTIDTLRFAAKQRDREIERLKKETRGRQTIINQNRLEIERLTSTLGNRELDIKKKDDQIKSLYQNVGAMLCKKDRTFGPITRKKSIVRKKIGDSQYAGQMESGKRHGFGANTYANGNTYVGEWKDDKKDGNGAYTYANGNVYVGEWKDDKRNGKGKLTDKNGKLIHEGTWKTYASGNVYVGDFKDDKFHGKGTFTWNSGSLKGEVYVGEWKNNKQNGYGKHTNADGSIYHDGMWKDCERVR
eukprot:g10873.t1